MEKQYVASERAHFMCPNMNFGILVRLNGVFDENKFKKVTDNMASAHPFLRAVMKYEDGSERMYYDILSESRISLYINDGEFDLSEYESIMKKERNIFESGLLDIYVYKGSECFEVLLLAHHLLTDGRGLLQLAEEMADCYSEGKTIEVSEERLIRDISELPEGSRLSGISRMLVKRANSQWKKEGHRVSYDDYLRFEKDYNLKHRLKYIRYEVDDDTYSDMRKKCHENGFTMNDLLMAEMFVRTGARKIIIAADIRDRIKKYNKGSLGNYSTAIGIVSRNSSKDVVKRANEVHRTVQKTISNNKKLMTVLACYFEMDPLLLDAAAISGMGAFKSKAASFVGGGMFGFARPSSYSITNLGKTDNKNIMSALFIPPASPAAILTLGVVTVNGKMYGCTGRCE